MEKENKGQGILKDKKVIVYIFFKEKTFSPLCPIHHLTERTEI